MLEGRLVTPGPGDPRAGGGYVDFSLEPSENRLCYLIFPVVSSPPTVAHLHKGGAGANGPIVLTLKADPAEWRPPTTCVGIEPALLADILAHPGGYYVDVHSKAFPNGAVRGQVR
jgi:hypothetical protein